MSRIAVLQYAKPGARTSAGLFFLILALSLPFPSRSIAAADGPRPNVLLITVDTLRPDALGWVAGRDSTPAIDALAAGAFRFPGAIAPVPLTLPSHLSMLTALLPRRHGVRDNGQVVPAGTPEDLAQRLGASGYATAAFVSGFPLDSVFGLDRGFALYDDRFSTGPRDRLERPAPETVDAALSWIGGRVAPWFVWVHLYDPHDPYDGADAAPHGDLRAAYQGEVAAVDRALSRLLGDPRLGGPRLTVFAADHGESLGEHGEATHGFFVYQSTLEVPLLFHWPGRVPAGESRSPVRLVDLSPTVLELLELPPWRERDGISLAPLLAGRAMAIPPAIAESRRPWHSYGWSPLDAVIDGRWKLIAAPRGELFDLASDPSEANNLFDRERRVARRLHAKLKAVPEAGPSATSIDDAETLAKLASLGYTGGSRVPAVVPGGLADPKDRIEIWNRLGAAEAALDRGADREALAGFDAALAVDPDNPFALARSAEALRRLGDVATARARLTRAVARAPERVEVRVALAELLSSTGADAEAVPHWMELVRDRPREPSYWSALGSALGRSGERSRSVEAFARAVEIDPARADLHIRLAFAAYGAGDKARALEELMRAAELSGGAAFPHAGALGILLDEGGRGDEAVRWLAASRRGEAEFAEARLRLARLLAVGGDASGARAALTEAITADPRLAGRADADPVLRALRREP